MEVYEKIYTVTPINRFCLTCTKKKCNGDCKEFRENQKQLNEEYKTALKKAKKRKKTACSR